jgi:hypothetical protein
MKMTVKEMLEIMAAILLVPFLLVWGSFRWTLHQYDKYVDRWIAELQAYDPQKPLPEMWKQDVFLRRLRDGEWVLAAIYHGGCCRGRYGEFNAMVLRDSRGRISTYDESPCADGIEGLGEYWQELVPAKTLDELYQRQRRFAGERSD